MTPGLERTGRQSCAPPAGSRAQPQRSEPQLAELPRVALPVLGDLDPEVEVDRRAQQGLDLLAGDGPDLAQPGPPVTDHDALLRGPLDVQAGADVQQRLFPRAGPPPPPPLRHPSAS